jgi:hypothetical protein
MPRQERERDAAWVARCIVTALRWSEQPLTRDELTEHVFETSRALFGLRWQRTTAARRVREAFKALRRQGYPILSDGTGFKLATTNQERHQAAEKMRKTARSLFVEADLLEAAPIPADPVQGRLAEVPGFEARP